MILFSSADLYTKAKEEYLVFESELEASGYCEGNNLADKLEKVREKREEILDERSSKRVF